MFLGGINTRLVEFRSAGSGDRKVVYLCNMSDKKCVARVNVPGLGAFDLLQAAERRDRT